MCRVRITELEVSSHVVLGKVPAGTTYWTAVQRTGPPYNILEFNSVQLCQGLVTLKSAVDSLTASVQQQETQHLSAADAQQRQLHAFNLALLEQAEELAALQALLGSPSRKRQSSRRRVTEDLMDSLDNLQVGLWPGAQEDVMCLWGVLRGIMFQRPVIQKLADALACMRHCI